MELETKLTIQFIFCIGGTTILYILFIYLLIGTLKGQYDVKDEL